jgi:hypothetical protein
MDDEITLDRQSLELLVEYANIGLSAMRTSMGTEQSPSDYIDRGARISINAAITRASSAIYCAERKIFEKELDDWPQSGADKMSDKAEKVRALEDGYDFSDSKTDWIEGRRK